MQTQLIRQLLDFLVPPDDGKDKTDQDAQTNDDMTNFERVMQCAQGWRDLHMLVDMIDQQLNTRDARSKRDGFATYMVERDNRFLLLGVHRNDADGSLHITQHIVGKQESMRLDPKRLRLVVSDMVDGLGKGVLNG